MICYKIRLLILLLFSAVLISCKNNKASDEAEPKEIITESKTIEAKETIIIDSDLSFEEAIQGTKAPQAIIDQLVLIDVLYHSVDGNIHRGQMLTNKKLEQDVKHMFDFMLEHNFVIEKAIPIVKYNWSDSLSMDDNNSSSFCYRNVSYSKHAAGMAIDINPRFNPLRWKNSNKPNQPEGALSDTTVNGTLHPDHVVVKEFRKLGFRWGHTFSKYYDDHHFEKSN